MPQQCHSGSALSVVHSSVLCLQLLCGKPDTKRNAGQAAELCASYLFLHCRNLGKASNDKPHACWRWMYKGPIGWKQGVRMEVLKVPLHPVLPLLVPTSGRWWWFILRNATSHSVLWSPPSTRVQGLSDSVSLGQCLWVWSLSLTLVDQPSRIYCQSLLNKCGITVVGTIFN